MRPTHQSGMARFLLFLATSGTAALANVAARWMFSRIVVYEAAVALGYLVGVAVAFVAARRFVFRGTQGRQSAQLARFALVNAVGFAQVWLVSVGLLRVVFPAVGFDWQAETVAHVIGTGSPALLSYYLHARFSFRTSTP